MTQVVSCVHIALLLAALLSPAVSRPQEPSKPAAVVAQEILRVGIVAYDDVRAREASMEHDFNQIDYTLRFATGTAEEVLNWVTSGLVDVAVLSPGALVATGAVLRNEERNKRLRDGDYPAWDARYLVTPAQLPTQNPFASDARHSSGDFVYESQILVNRKAWGQLKIEFPGSDEQTIRDANQKRRLQFVFGDPLSLSGTIAPQAQLRAIDVNFESRWEYSFGHKDTLDLLLHAHTVKIGEDSRERIGFIFDGSVPGVSAGLPADEAATEAQKLLAQMKSDLVPVHIRRPPEPNEVGLGVADGGSVPMPPEIINRLKDPDAPLDDLPVEVWVVRPDFGVTQAKNLRNKLLELKDAQTHEPLFIDQNEEAARPNAIDVTAARVRLWAQAAKIDLGRSDSGRSIYFSEIIHSMRHYERRYGTSPRLALVLSGGGAKCAYQAGVIEEIERELLELHDYQLHAPDASGKISPRSVPPDINLVVGTSGGALNALPVAIGITARPDAGRTMLTGLWQSTDLATLLDTYWVTSATLGMLFAMALWFAARLLVALGSRADRWGRSALARLRTTRGDAAAISISPDPRITWRILLAIVCVFAVVITAFQVMRWLHPARIERLIPIGRPAYYLVWLPLNVGNMWTVAWLGIIIVAVKYLPGPRAGLPRFWSSIDRMIHISGVVALLILALVFATLFGGKSLVRGEVVREVVMKSMRTALGYQIRPDQCGANCLESHKESWLSNEIAGDNLTRRRDLVITVTMLDETSNSDRYVYLPANANGAAPSYEQRALALGQSSQLTFLSAPTNLVPFLIASGSVFPFFPARDFDDPVGLRPSVQAVDGGFAHNSPVEAALDWGATHIIVVEASPSARIAEQSSFASNLNVAFDHLFEQAQMTDRRSRERVEIYYVRPQKEILKTLEFIPGLMRQAIEAGKRDSKEGRFVQFSKPPELSRLETQKSPSP